MNKQILARRPSVTSLSAATMLLVSSACGDRGSRLKVGKKSDTSGTVETSSEAVEATSSAQSSTQEDDGTSPADSDSSFSSSSPTDESGSSSSGSSTTEDSEATSDDPGTQLGPCDRTLKPTMTVRGNRSTARSGLGL